MLSVFVFLLFSCLAWCLLSFLSVLLFLGSLFGKFFRERTFVFGYRCGSCLFWCCFAYVFALLFGFSCPKMSRENSLLVRSVFLNKFSGANFCLWPPYCHRPLVPFLKGGNAVRFFHFVFFGVWFGVFCRLFAVLLFLGSLFEKFSGANFCFGVSVFVVCVLVLFCLCFCFSFGFFVPETVLKKFSCCQVWCFWVVVFLPLVVSPTSSFFSLFFFERDSSGSHRAHPHTHLVFLFLFLVFVPRRVCLFTRFGRASFPSGVFSGCHSGPRAFFGFSRDFSEACFLDARRQGCFFASRACVVFPLFVLFCGFFHTY